jgi:hypothetical protein
VDRDPAVAMPQKVYYAERKYGRSTSAGDEIRARHRELVEARLKGREELAQTLSKQKEQGRQRAILAQLMREKARRQYREAVAAKKARASSKQVYRNPMTELENTRRKTARKLRGTTSAIATMTVQTKCAPAARRLSLDSPRCTPPTLD